MQMELHHGLLRVQPASEPVRRRVCRGASGDQFKELLPADRAVGCIRTPGHQVLFVKLAKTGPVVISGDLYHWAAERALDRMAPREREQGQTKASRDALEAFMTKNKAQLWVQHDLAENAKLDKSPKYYD
jgi:hypothetical protein